MLYSKSLTFIISIPNNCIIQIPSLYNNLNLLKITSQRELQTNGEVVNNTKDEEYTIEIDGQYLDTYITVGSNLVNELKLRQL